MITVLLVDDHHVIRSGLQSLLDAADGITVVGSASDGAEANDEYQRVRPDVVLMDLSMPGVDGIDATTAITAIDPAARIVVLTSFGDRQRVTQALDAGACGYLLKDAAPDDIVAAVRAAAAGGSPMDARIGAILLAERAERGGGTEQRGTDGAQLSERELEVLGLVREGLLNKEIGRRLGIAEKTVKAHLTRIFARIGVQDRTQAALWAERSGLFPTK
jgi:DNA-binding NarL/FixJ family response regulator